MYTEDQYYRAFALYDECGSVTKSKRHFKGTAIKPKSLM